MVIDAHQHFWKYDPARHAWIDEEMAVIRRDFLPPELEQTYKEQGIDGCVAVQADQTLQETQFLLGLSGKYDFIKGVVGWADLRNPRVEEQLAEFGERQKIKGFRHVVQGEPDHNFLLRKDFMRGISLLGNHNFTYDILVFPHQLGAVLEFVRRFPHQKFVIDHLAKPYIKDQYYDGWAVLMTEIAKSENVYCKLSGMVTEADYNRWTPKQMTPYIDLVLGSFGPGRIMYGSDWPVCLVAGTYAEVIGLVTDAIAQLSPSEQEAIMGLNAISFYNL